MLKKIFNQEYAYDIKDQIVSMYDTVTKKADENKKTYFKRKHMIQIISLIVSIVPTLAGAIAIMVSGKWVYALIAVLTIPNAILTYIINRHNSKKNAETWVRHRLHQMELECEFFSYKYKEGDYKGKNEEECIDILKTRFLNVERANIKRFEDNMKEFEE